MTKAISNRRELGSYCTFLVRGASCGVPVDRVREIVCDQTVTPVPLSRDAICGLINLRGQILTVVDVGRLLGLSRPVAESADQDVPRFHLITDVGSELISVCVDEMGPVVTPSREELEAIPRSVDPDAAALILGAARMPEELVLLLDLDRLREMKGSIGAAKRMRHRHEPATESLPLDKKKNERETP